MTLGGQSSFAAPPRAESTSGTGKSRRNKLVARNVNINARRTSMRLEIAMWNGLEEICRRERVSLHDLCTWINAQRSEASFTGSVRIFILTYFVAAATEDGHAGHGTRVFRDKLKYGSAAPIIPMPNKEF